MIDDEKYLRQLHEVFELIESLTLNLPSDEPIQYLIQTIIPLIIERAHQTEVQFQDNVRHKIRRQTLEILSMIPFPSNRALLPLNLIIHL